MVTLALSKDTKSPKHQALFTSGWINLIEQFKSANNALFGLPDYSLLEINLQTGLSALKTLHCGTEIDRHVNCPTCLNQFRILGEKLPNSHHTQSSLICRITGQIMNDDNPPLVLPNGYAYSRQSMEDMAIKNNGNIICPRTKEVYKFESLRKAFIS